MIDLSLFRFSCPVEIRFADMDALAHVNNAKYFTYMETGRLQYFRQIVGWQGDRSELGVILARAACDFKLPLALGDLAEVHVRVTRIGEKSFEFGYMIVRKPDQEVAAIGSSVQVAYDYEMNTSIRIPDEWRQKMLAYEPGLRG
jgi:acyl-CoA thioester hydrolase